MKLLNHQTVKYTQLPDRLKKDTIHRLQHLKLLKTKLDLLPGPTAGSSSSKSFFLPP
jgi:hypothetical protein